MKTLFRKYMEMMELVFIYQLCSNYLPGAKAGHDSLLKGLWSPSILDMCIGLVQVTEYIRQSRLDNNINSTREDSNVQFWNL